MSSWSVDPGGVFRVLTHVEAEQASLLKAASGVGDAFETFAGATGSLLSGAAGDLSAALVENAGLMEQANSRITACAAGASSATAAYVAGDEEMAAATISTALGCAVTGDLEPLGLEP
ncbi:DUF6507 family protein [Microbacterium sp. M3]|uniref:DUF6507 family protein n=1 Tax=Microbacterium arthrosphaerae TaxID=792652 RepID=A0ABU4H3X6_9MICO|nr:MULTISPECIES: DUF6507 family protein [Microbacterium]MDW4572599.1 DUF6507 family protein [Microbacterium arthrosphaerae]MDW7606454.1 DUF6507 family protein [Microbacterium sp. M3]